MARFVKTIALVATAAALMVLASAEVFFCEAAAAWDWEGDSPVLAAQKPGQPPISVDADGDFRRRCQAPGVVRYFDFYDQAAAKYGKIWLLPYNTGKDPRQAHPTAYTWYDELIISKRRIPDPAVRSSL
jgi:hypothetical protein